MKAIVLLQVRSSSKRLPNKCFLLIKKIPSIVYLYKRVVSKKYFTSILTSNHKSDDFLSYTLKRYKLNFFRGSLENVKKRFLKYLEKKNFDTIVRITGDNLFIDSSLISMLLNNFKKSNKNYLYIDYKKNNLPYGISVEIFNKKLLKNSKSKSNFDNEHVTSIFNKKNAQFKLNRYFKKKKYHLRCTLDFIEDYLALKRILDTKNLNTKWNILCKEIKKITIYNNYFSFKVIKTRQIKRNELTKILLLKKSYWKYSLNSQKKFFYKNYKFNDKHILLYNKNKLIGYNCLKNIKINNIKCLLLDSFIVEKSYRGKGISSMLISKSMNEILNLDKKAFLLANKNSIKLYMGFGWKIIKSKFFKTKKKDLLTMKFNS